ncbi:MliC family protein [Jannaschia sp. Os4]|uniref:MliC family protein n=1 Tax=Jannaschia sp. Os4 TaxID=2807617 RepID=UPI00193A2316|nr:MliC family protein [Jannaschia sp. Os4]MBM2576804.1 MliC family protein [Jannaschia sp. Os4]
MKRILPLLLLVACAPAPEQEEVVPVAFAGGTPFLCDDGQTIRTQLRGDRLGLVLGDGTPLDLPAVQTPAGLRYAADGWVWFRRGDNAILTQQGGQVNCRIADTTAAAPPTGGVPAADAPAPSGVRPLPAAITAAVPQASATAPAPQAQADPAFPPVVAPVAPGGVFISPDLDL